MRKFWDLRYEGRNRIPDAREDTPVKEPTDFVFDLRITIRAHQDETEDQIYHWLLNRISDIPDVQEAFERNEKDLH